jgi:competence protein ComEA
MNQSFFRRFGAALLVAAFTLASGDAFAAAKTFSGRVNLNTASAAQLEELPGIGPALASRIIEHRQKNGSFRTVEEVLNVKGVGEKSFARIQAYLTVGAATPKDTPKP